MAIDHYTTAARVRQLDAMLDTTDSDGNYEYTDAVIESVIDDHAQPLIDSLLGFAFTVPFTENDTGKAIAKVAADITASVMISGDVAQFAGGVDPEKATRLMDKAMEWIQDIIDGKKYISHARITKVIGVNYDEDPDTRPSNDVFTGTDGSQWYNPTESRGT